MTELAAPPPHPVILRWSAQHLHDSVLVRARSWYVSRATASRLLGVERDKLQWELVAPESLNGEARNIVEVDG
jgi:hypothetical protein